jgi:hypothetical protein
MVVYNFGVELIGASFGQEFRKPDFAILQAIRIGMVVLKHALIACLAPVEVHGPTATISLKYPIRFLENLRYNAARTFN